MGKQKEPEHYLIKVRSRIKGELEKACGLAGDEECPSVPYVSCCTWTKRLQRLAAGYVRLRKREDARRKG